MGKKRGIGVLLSRADNVNFISKIIQQCVVNTKEELMHARQVEAYACLTNSLS